MNFWIHRKIPGKTLSMPFPKINLVDFEQKMPQIRNLKILGIRPKYETLLKNLKSIPWVKVSNDSWSATIFTELTLRYAIG